MPPIPTVIPPAGVPGPTIAELASGDGFVPAVFAELTGIAPPSATATASVAFDLSAPIGGLLSGLAPLGLALGITEATGLGTAAAGAGLTDAITVGPNPYPVGTITHELWAAGLASGDPQGSARPSPANQEALVAYLRGVFAYKITHAAATGALPAAPSAVVVSQPRPAGLMLGLLPFSGALVLFGLLHVLRAFVTAVGGIVGAATALVPFVGPFVSSGALTASHAVADTLGTAASAFDPLIASYFRDAAALVSWLWQEVAGNAALTHALAQTVVVLAHGQRVPKLPAWARGRLDSLGARLAAQQEALQATQARVAHPVTPGLTPALANELARLHAKIGAAEARSAAHIAALDSQLRAERAHTDEIEKIVTAGAGAGIVAGGLAALGSSWIRCRNWRNLGRSICGVPGNLLNDLLALALDFFVLLNICQVIPWLEAAFSEVASPLIGTLTRAGAGLCNPEHKPPDVLAVPRIFSPPVLDPSGYITG